VFNPWLFKAYSFHSGNLKAHLKAKHNEQYQLVEKFCNQNSDCESESSSVAPEFQSAASAL
jgi:hypothetical protein